MATLGTVENYIADARVLLLDKVRPYRYEDDEVLQGLNLVLLEVRRIRPDIFITRLGNEVPFYLEVNATPVPIEPQFRMALVFGMVSYTLMRDDEEIQDSRVNTFYDKFHNILTGVRQRSFPTNAPSNSGGPAPSSPE